jgi:hypothetical protein
MPFRELNTSGTHALTSVDNGKTIMVDNDLVGMSIQLDSAVSLGEDWRVTIKKKGYRFGAAPILPAVGEKIDRIRDQVGVAMPMTDFELFVYGGQVYTKGYRQHRASWRTLSFPLEGGGTQYNVSAVNDREALLKVTCGVHAMAVLPPLEQVCGIQPDGNRGYLDADFIFKRCDSNAILTFKVFGYEDGVGRIDMIDGQPYISMAPKDKLRITMSADQSWVVD